MTSAHNDRHLVRMEVNASSEQLAARLSTANGELMSASSIRSRQLYLGLNARISLYRIPLTANYRRLHLLWLHENRAWDPHWQQIAFFDKFRFNFGTMMATYMLDAVPVNAAFQSAYWTS